VQILSEIPDDIVDDMLIYVIDVVRVEVGNRTLGGLRDELIAELLGRIRFKKAGNLLNDWLKNNLKGIFEGILGANLVLLQDGVDGRVAVPG